MPPGDRWLAGNRKYSTDMTRWGAGGGGWGRTKVRHTKDGEDPDPTLRATKGPFFDPLKPRQADAQFRPPVDALAQTTRPVTAGRGAR